MHLCWVQVYTQKSPPKVVFQLRPGVFAKVAGEDRVEAEPTVVAAWAETLAPGTWAEQTRFNIGALISGIGFWGPLYLL